MSSQSLPAPRKNFILCRRLVFLECNIGNRNFTVQYTRYIKVFLEVVQEDGSTAYKLLGSAKGHVMDAESRQEITTTIYAGQTYYYECQITVPFHETDIFNYANGYVPFDGEPNTAIVAKMSGNRIER